MTYSTGQLIQATDYNGFVSTTVGANLNAIWGNSGVATNGYGQTALATVATAGTVGATEWANLVNKLSSIGAHTNTTITSRTPPVAGNTITILSNLNTDLTNCWAARSNAVSQGTAVSPQTGFWYLANNTPNTAWTITTTHTVTFANASAAAWFFNAGGTLKWSVVKTTNSTSQDLEFNTLANTVCGAIFLSGSNTAHSIGGTAYTGITKSGGTGTPTTLATTTGWYNLTTTATTLYDQYDPTAPYTSNHIYFQAAVDSNTTPSVLTLTTKWVNTLNTDIGATNIITGGAANAGPTTNVQYFPPETTNLSNTWGAITISAVTSVA